MDRLTTTPLVQAMSSEKRIRCRMHLSPRSHARRWSHRRGAVVAAATATDTAARPAAPICLTLLHTIRRRRSISQVDMVLVQVDTDTAVTTLLRHLRLRTTTEVDASLIRQRTVIDAIRRTARDETANIGMAGTHTRHLLLRRVGLATAATSRTHRLLLLRRRTDMTIVVESQASERC